MDSIQYLPLDRIAAADLLPILNKSSTRRHLIEHDVFDLNRVRDWVADKVEEDACDGCLVRAILLDETPVGWCGIQQSELGYEIAIVLDDGSWGIGKAIFKQLILWCEAFQHETVYIHLLHTRPAYNFLHRLAERTFETQMLGDTFTTYELNVHKMTKQF